MRIEIEDLTGCGAELVVIQEAGIPGPQGLPGSLDLTTIVPPIEYDAGTYTLKLADGTTLNQVLAWDGSYWIARNVPPRRVEYRTITLAEENAKEITLAHPLTEPSEILFDIADGGGSQFPDVDFVIVGNVIRWDGMSLDGVLSEGDRVRVVYQ